MCGSDLDVPLTQEGFEQAKKLASHFKDKKINKIYCSDLDRSYSTAKILADFLKVDLIASPLLRELKIGDWAGQDRILEKWRNYYLSEKKKGIPREEIRIPNGENSWDHQKRIKKFLENIIKEEGEIIIVAHSGTNKVFIGTINNVDPDDFYTIKQDNTCVNELVFNGSWKVLSLNNISHLN
ncbi:MAG: histidine phosphatase family protein [Nanoarchaeota archaeon]